jgi:hypothetical protein
MPSKGSTVKLSKNAFLMTMLMILALYGVANVMLFYNNNGFHYVDTDPFLIITSIFAFMIMISLPRTVEILIGSESQPPRSEIYDKEISDSEYGS